VPFEAVQLSVHWFMLATATQHPSEQSVKTEGETPRRYTVVGNNDNLDRVVAPPEADVDGL
jgi:hypothetical protein